MCSLQDFLPDQSTLVRELQACINVRILEGMNHHVLGDPVDIVGELRL